MYLKKFVLVLTTVALMFACTVPCYAESYFDDNFCKTEISPLYDLTDVVNV